MVRNWMRIMTIWLDIKLDIVLIMTALRNKLTNCRLNTLLNVWRQVFIFKDFVLYVYMSPPKTIFIYYIHKCSSAFFSFPFFIILSPIRIYSISPSYQFTSFQLSNHRHISFLFVNVCYKVFLSIFYLSSFFNYDLCFIHIPFLSFHLSFVEVSFSPFVTS